MPVQVKLEEIIDGIELSAENGMTLINLKTGEVIFLLHEMVREAENESSVENLPQWMQEDIALAVEILENEDNYTELPNQFDVDEYSMIEEFSYMQKGNTLEQLLQVIRGKGAFRRFKDKIIELGVEEAWYAFRDDQYKKIAIAFCEDNDLEYV